MTIEVRHGSIEDFEADLKGDHNGIDRRILRIGWKRRPMKGLEPMTSLEVHAAAVVHGLVLNLTIRAGNVMPRPDCQVSESDQKTFDRAQPITIRLRDSAKQECLDLRGGAFHTWSDST